MSRSGWGLLGILHCSRALDLVDDPGFRSPVRKLKQELDVLWCRLYPWTN